MFQLLLLCFIIKWSKSGRPNHNIVILQIMIIQRTKAIDFSSTIFLLNYTLENTIYGTNFKLILNILKNL